MESQDYWKLFMDTGAPEMYLLYHHARKTESNNVFNDSGTGSAGSKLQ